jgi:hypothetical protein
MVRRGRRFESVRRLCKSAANRRFLFRGNLHDLQRAMGMDPFMDPSDREHALEASTISPSKRPRAGRSASSGSSDVMSHPRRRRCAISAPGSRPTSVQTSNRLWEAVKVRVHRPTVAALARWPTEARESDGQRADATDRTRRPGSGRTVGTRAAPPVPTGAIDITRSGRVAGAPARGAGTRPSGCGRRTCGGRSCRGRRPGSRHRCVLIPWRR